MTHTRYWMAMTHTWYWMAMTHTRYWMAMTHTRYWMAVLLFEGTGKGKGTGGKTNVDSNGVARNRKPEYAVHLVVDRQPQHYVYGNQFIGFTENLLENTDEVLRTPPPSSRCGSLLLPSICTDGRSSGDVIAF